MSFLNLGNFLSGLSPSARTAFWDDNGALPDFERPDAARATSWTGHDLAGGVSSNSLSPNLDFEGSISLPARDIEHTLPTSSFFEPADVNLDLTSSAAGNVHSSSSPPFSGRAEDDLFSLPSLRGSLAAVPTTPFEDVDDDGDFSLPAIKLEDPAASSQEDSELAGLDGSAEQLAGLDAFAELSTLTVTARVSDHRSQPQSQLVLAQHRTGRVGAKIHEIDYAQTVDEDEVRLRAIEGQYYGHDEDFPDNDGSDISDDNDDDDPAYAESTDSNNDNHNDEDNDDNDDDPAYAESNDSDNGNDENEPRSLCGGDKRTSRKYAVVGADIQNEQGGKRVGGSSKDLQARPKIGGKSIGYTKSLLQDHTGQGQNDREEGKGGKCPAGLLKLSVQNVLSLVASDREKLARIAVLVDHDTTNDDDDELTDDDETSRPASRKAPRKTPSPWSVVGPMTPLSPSWSSHTSTPTSYDGTQDSPPPTPSKPSGRKPGNKRKSSRASKSANPGSTTQVTKRAQIKWTRAEEKFVANCLLEYQKAGNHKETRYHDIAARLNEMFGEEYRKKHGPNAKRTWSSVKNQSGRVCRQYMPEGMDDRKPLVNGRKRAIVTSARENKKRKRLVRDDDGDDDRGENAAGDSVLESVQRSEPGLGITSIKSEPVASEEHIGTSNPGPLEITSIKSDPAASTEHSKTYLDGELEEGEISECPTTNSSFGLASPSIASPTPAQRPVKRMRTEADRRQNWWLQYGK